MKNLYFAYGSNMDEAQMKKRCPDSILIGKGYIENYKLCFPQIAITRGLLGVAGIREDVSEDTYGLIYKLTDKDLELLHTFEGYDKNSISNSSYFPKNVRFYLYDNVSNTYISQESQQVIIYQSNFDKGDDFYVSDEYLLLLLKPMIKYGLDNKYILKIIERAKTNPKPSFRVKLKKLRTAKLLTILKVMFKIK